MTGWSDFLCVVEVVSCMFDAVKEFKEREADFNKAMPIWRVLKDVLVFFRFLAFDASLTEVKWTVLFPVSMVGLLGGCYLFYPERFNALVLLLLFTQARTWRGYW